MEPAPARIRSRGSLTDEQPEASDTASDYAFDAPDTLTEGWTTFRLVNRGGQPYISPRWEQAFSDDGGKS